MGSGYWWVNRASKAVKEQRPAVKRMKNGNSFFGYTLTSWKTVAEKRNHIEREEKQMEAQLY